MLINNNFIDFSNLGGFDKDTEVLTPSGWIKLSDYIGDQLVMKYDPSDNSGSFSKPVYFGKRENNYFWSIKGDSSGLDQLLCEENKLLVYNKKSDHYKIYNMSPTDLLNRKSLKKGYYKFNTCFNIKSEGIPIEDDWIRLEVMIQADGRVKKRKTGFNFVELHFKRTRKIERARYLLNKLNISHKEYIVKDGSTYFSFRVPINITKELSKYYNANYDQLKIISEECLLWDGYSGYRSSYSSTNKSNIDLIQFSFISTNTRASIYTSYPKNLSWNVQYNVIPTRNNLVGYFNYPEKISSVGEFRYSIITDTGYILCRRNGYTFISGL